MQKRFFILILFSFSTLKQVKAWGFLGHQTINYYAVFALPPEIFGFYKLHIEYIKKHAVDADNRRYLIDKEACRHYIDCDRYEKSAPLDTIPHFWKSAVLKYTEDSLNAHGIVPWHILLMKYQLVEAFKNKDLKKILKYSADIGHYVGDAHVPLHTCSNYNGQKTDQLGIHALWETRLPQLFFDSIVKIPGTASYLYDPTEHIWNAVSQSYACVDSVLRIEKQVSQLHLQTKKSFEMQGNVLKPVYSSAFSSDYYYAMDKMVERRMLAAILSLASFWYSAWVDAGQPNLESLGNLSPSQIEEIEKESAADPSPGQRMKGRQEIED